MGDSVDNEVEGDDNDLRPCTDRLVLVEVGGGGVVVDRVEFACRDPCWITRPSP